MTTEQKAWMWAGIRKITLMSRSTAWRHAWETSGERCIKFESCIGMGPLEFDDYLKGAHLILELGLCDIETIDIPIRALGLIRNPQGIVYAKRKEDA